MKEVREYTEWGVTQTQEDEPNTLSLLLVNPKLRQPEVATEARGSRTGLHRRILTGKGSLEGEKRRTHNIDV